MKPYRRHFLGSSLLVLGSTLMDALATPLWRWDHSLAVQTKPAANTGNAGVQFVDVAQEAGLNVPNVWGGADRKRYLIEAKGSGLAFFDYDHDGWLDIYLTNGTRLGEKWPEGKAPTSQLFKNNRDGTFSNVTEKSGLARTGWQTGVCVGDYDNDGWDDLFCCFWGHNILFHNNGDGTFTDVSHRAGVADERGYYGLASVFVDMDGDGWPDLAVANDSVPRYLYRNLGNGKFEDVSYVSGFALTDTGLAQASMGLAVGDYNRDDRPDIYVTVFSDDFNTLYRNDGNFSMSEVSFQAGVANPTIPFLGWGTGFLDYDNDGLLDLIAVNGHVYKWIDSKDWGTTWAQRPLLFRNLDGTKFSEVPPATGSGLADVIPARGLAIGDLFNDGKLDIVINNLESALTLLRNSVKNDNHWIEFHLVGGAGSPRDAIGAKVLVTTKGVRQSAQLIIGGSYGSSSDPRLHFGLGSATALDEVEIRWPSGKKEIVPVSAIDRVVTVIEGKGADREKKGPA